MALTISSAILEGALRAAVKQYETDAEICLDAGISRTAKTLMRQAHLCQTLADIIQPVSGRVLLVYEDEADKLSQYLKHQATDVS